MTLETIIILVIAILGAIFVILFITNVWNPFTSAAKELPQTAQIAIAACNGLTEIGDMLNNAYCMQARDTATSNKKVTCGYLYDQKLLTKSMTCADDVNTITPKVCVQEFQTKVNAKLYVNNKLCASLVKCTDLGGEVKNAIVKDAAGKDIPGCTTSVLASAGEVKDVTDKAEVCCATG